MEDYSGLLDPDPISALTPTSQAAGNSTSSNRFARTGPGSVPVDPMPPSRQQADPAIDATAYDTPVRIGAGGAKVTQDGNTARPTPYTEDDGSGRWRTAQRSLGLPDRPRVALGQRNELP